MRFLPAILLFFILPVGLWAQNNDLQNTANLASKYYQEKSYAKAAELYEQLFSATKAEGYFNMYFDCLLGIPDYERAEKAIKKGMKSTKSDSYWYIQWGFLKKTLGQLDESDKLYEKAIEANSNPAELPIVANNFINRREYEYAEKVYLRARAEQGQNKKQYNYELARIYYYMRNYDQMLNEYIEWAKQKEGNLDIVKSNLLSVLSVDNDGEISKQMKSYVLKHVQQEPDELIYSRLLVWLFVQDKNFVGATRQMIALDKRTGQEGMGILDLANISASNGFYDDAAIAYDYLISKGKEAEFYALAVQQRMLMHYEKFVSDGMTDANRLKLIQTQFNQTFVSLGVSSATSELLIKYAHLLTFYLNQPDEALKQLNQLLSSGGLSAQQIAELKAELADVNVYTGDFGEAIIIYSQVIESNKNNLLGDDIKFKKARLGYYMGNFGWAKAQLNALRASTSKLIANDAMDLSLFINENMDDSITTPLELFARADLQIFRRNYSEAITRLDSISQIYPDNSLADDVLFRKATIFQEEGKFAEAATLYEQVIKNYSWDNLADDALFRLAVLYQNKLNRKTEAMELYKRMMTDYPSSVFVVDARTEYRKMQESVNNETIPDNPSKH